MKLSDEQIHQAVESCRNLGQPVTGARVREVLRGRFGAAGGTGRVYRMLRSPPPARAPEIEALQAQLQAAQQRAQALESELEQTLARAQRAEYREQAHQDQWALEIHRLREQVRILEGQGRSIGAPTHAEWLRLQHERAPLRARPAAAISGDESGYPPPDGL